MQEAVYGDAAGEPDEGVGAARCEEDYGRVLPAWTARRSTRADERGAASVVPVLSGTEREHRLVVSGVAAIDWSTLLGQRRRCISW